MDVKELAKNMPLLVIKTNVLATLDTSSIIQTDYLTVTPGENLEKLVDLISHSIRLFLLLWIKTNV
jgi:CIC family chloride channel protein